MLIGLPKVEQDPEVGHNLTSSIFSTVATPFCFEVQDSTQKPKLGTLYEIDPDIFWRLWLQKSTFNQAFNRFLHSPIHLPSCDMSPPALFSLILLPLFFLLCLSKLSAGSTVDPHPAMTYFLIDFVFFSFDSPDPWLGTYPWVMCFAWNLSSLQYILWRSFGWEILGLSVFHL